MIIDDQIDSRRRRRKNLVNDQDGGVPKEIQIVYRSFVEQAETERNYEAAIPCHTDKGSQSTATTVEELAVSDSFSSWGPTRGILKCKTVLDSLERDLLAPLHRSVHRRRTQVARQQPNKQVSFSIVTVHYHSVVLADPLYDALNGPPVAIGKWKESEVFESLEQFEKCRPKQPRFIDDLYLSPSLRARMLFDASAEVDFSETIEDIYRGLHFCQSIEDIYRALPFPDDEDQARKQNSSECKSTKRKGHRQPVIGMTTR